MANDQAVICRERCSRPSPAPAAAAGRHRRGGGGRRGRDAVVAGPELEPAVRQPVGAATPAQVVQALQTAGIKYKLNDSTGAVMVPAEKVHEARLQARLAGSAREQQQRPRSDQQGHQASASASSWRTARYQYALETELARTIAALRGVEAARVHLAHAAAVGIRARPAAGDAPRCSCSCGRAAGWNPSRCIHRASGGLEHSGARRRAGHRRRPAGPPAVGAGCRGRQHRHASSSRPRSASRIRYNAAHRAVAGAAGRRRPRARPGDGGARHRRHRRDARTVPPRQRRRAQRADRGEHEPQRGRAAGRRTRRAHQPAAARPAWRSPRPARGAAAVAAPLRTAATTAARPRRRRRRIPPSRRRATSRSIAR